MKTNVLLVVLAVSGLGACAKKNSEMGSSKPGSQGSPVVAKCTADFERAYFGVMEAYDRYEATTQSGTATREQVTLDQLALRGACTDLSGFGTTVCAFQVSQSITSELSAADLRAECEVVTN